MVYPPVIRENKNEQNTCPVTLFAVVGLYGDFEVIAIIVRMTQIAIAIESGRLEITLIQLSKIGAKLI